MRTVFRYVNPVLALALVCLMVVVACSSKQSTTSTPQTTPSSQTPKMAPATQPTTQPGQPATQPTQKSPSGDPGAVNIQLVAKNIAFDKKTITVPAGASVTIAFDNKDSGVPHNFALYQDSSASKPIFMGDMTMGPATTTYTFTAPSTPGKYFFRCDAHPTTMTGTFVVT